MRKQYHFRPSAHGLLAWDVDRLITHTQGLTPEALALSALRELDQPYWYDAEGETPTCRSIAQHMRLVQQADLAFPIIICPEGRLMDGMHRAVKALLAQKSTIMAYRLAALPQPDFTGVQPHELPYDEAIAPTS